MLRLSGQARLYAVSPEGQWLSRHAVRLRMSPRAPLTNAVESEGLWDAPGKHMLGAAAEMLAATHFALAGHAVFRPLADDRGVDLLVDRGAGRHLLVQVKSARVYGNVANYVFMRKQYFPLEEHRTVCLVIFPHDDPHASLFLIPASVWRTPARPFVDHDYIGLKSPPEYGLSITRNWRRELAPWDITTQLGLLLSD